MKRLWTTLVVTALVPACASEVRKVTYPPDFHYVDSRSISSAMWKIAVGVANLDQILSTVDPLGVDRRPDVLQQLKVIDEAARSLEPAGGSMVHRMLDDNLKVMLEDVDRARRAAEAKPPNYYLAARITGSCIYCHNPRP